ncbi:MAG: replication-relaxation family protein [Planctomycetota bacterium]
MSGAAGYVVQARDLAILRGFYECRTMTLRHVADLHFAGSYKAAQKRVAVLKRAGLLRELTPVGVGESAALVFRPKAYRLLVEHQALGELPAVGWKVLEKRADISPVTLRHELDVVSVRAAFENSARSSESPTLEVVRFTTWPRLVKFRSRRLRPKAGESPLLTLHPDGYAEVATASTIEPHRRWYFFLEVDRSTESLDRLVEKMHAYRDFYTRGGFARRQGMDPDDFKRYPYRVLFTFRTEARRKNAAAAFAEARPKLGGMPWLTKFDQTITDPLGSIWQTPASNERRPLF